MPFLAALPAIMAGAGLLGKLFGNSAKGSADQRMAENQQGMQQQQIQNNDLLQRAQLTSNDALQRAQMANSNGQLRSQMTNADTYNRAGMDLQRRQFAQQEPNAQARQAMVGSMLSRLQPLQMNGLSERVTARMPKMNSIIDSLGPEARQAGSLLASRGLSGLQSGPTKFDALAPLSLPELTQPAALNLPPATQMALQRSGLLEKLLGGAGLVGSIVGTVGQLGNFGGTPTSGNGLPIDPYGGG